MKNSFAGGKMKNVRLVYNVQPKLPDVLEHLRVLANNIWFVWHPEAISLFRRLDNNLWEETQHNPVAMLGRISQDRLIELSEDDSFITQMNNVYQDLQRYLSEAETYKFGVKEPHKFSIAYFSAEYGLAECIPIYSGGLGVLSGDHLKSASDLAIPLIGVGLLYQEGYFRQYLNNEGWQQEWYPQNDLQNMPISLERDAHGNPFSVEVKIKTDTVKIRIWRVQVGRIPLYLLDTNNIENSDANRDITSQLYGGDLEMRLKQEIVLGIGGARALQTLGLHPNVYHMNEGHSAFVSLERIRNLTVEKGLTFDEAKEIVFANNVFTTHTPVPAGIDRFPPELIKDYFSEYVKELGLSMDELLALGRENPADKNETFCMAVLAIKLSNKINGVSKLHKDVSQKMWTGVWSELPVKDIPIMGITNGIHISTWISEDIATLFDRYLGPNWREDPDSEKVWDNIDNIPDIELWRTHERRRERLVSFTRDRLRKQLRNRGASRSEINRAGEVLNPEALTIGFARRFATYKRGNLIFRDLERLSLLMKNLNKPFQIIFAGKAHPKDNAGKGLIKDIVNIIRQPDLRDKIVFLEDYDISIARQLVQGVDIWLNNPRRPLEACGTSGMKSTANGALNLSVLDGWWVEGFNMDWGWAIGSGEEYEDHDYQDEVESRAIYHLLEEEIIPLFYDRGQDNIPRGWIERMKKSMKNLCPTFNSHRMLEEYYERCYYPASLIGSVLEKDNMMGAKELNRWKKIIKQNWKSIKVSNIEVGNNQNLKVGDKLNVKVDIFLGEIKPTDVSVELYYGQLDAKGNITNRELSKLNCIESDSSSNHTFEGDIPCKRSGRFGFNIRITPSHENLANKFSENLIVWE